VSDLLGHHLGAVRAGIDVTVGAGLIALATDVDLECLEASAGKRYTMLLELSLEWIHD